MIALMRSVVKPFAEKQIELVETFADQAVIAIENVRLFEAVQARTRELQKSLEYQTATSEVLEVMSQSPTRRRTGVQGDCPDAPRAFAARCSATSSFTMESSLHIGATHNFAPNTMKVRSYACIRASRTDRNSRVARS